MAGLVFRPLAPILLPVGSPVLFVGEAATGHVRFMEASKKMSTSFYVVLLAVAVSFNWTSYVLNADMCYMVTCGLIVYACGMMTREDNRRLADAHHRLLECNQSSVRIADR